MARILVADDDVAVREVMTSLLERRSHAVTALEDGAALLRALRAGARADLCIVDWSMPGGGAELLRSVRRARPELPVILMSGSEWGLLEDGDQLGAQADVFLRKPFDLVEADRAIRTALAATGATERRSTPRRAITWRAELRSRDAVTPGLVRDLSLGGAQFRVPVASDLGAPGEELEGVVYGPHGEPVALAARVVYRTPADDGEDRVGLVFTDATAADVALRPLI
jgi:CheY-like chemotaxis protein